MSYLIKRASLILASNLSVEGTWSLFDSIYLASRPAESRHSSRWFFASCGIAMSSSTSAKVTLVLNLCSKT